MKFELNLGSSCSAAGTVKTTFSGTADTTKPDALKVEGGATGVAIQILDQSGAVIPLGQESTSSQPTASTATKLTYFARYISTATTVAAGTANGTAQLFLSYN